MAPNEGDRIIVDCGKIGPDYQPGHAHCDTLSFELSIKGKRIIVDSGCYGYEEGFIRQYNRGNVGHNTLMIDGQNQSEVWASHRCGRRAYPLYGELEENDRGEIIFEGAHDGYRRLAGRPLHHRKIVWSGEVIYIEDIIKGSGIHTVELRLHLQPDLAATLKDDKCEVFFGHEHVLDVMPLNHEVLEKGHGHYCPEFNQKLTCIVLCIKHTNICLPFKTGWVLTPNRA
jgi:uncharacterized heparinase superfamily protein